MMTVLINRELLGKFMNEESCKFEPHVLVNSCWKTYIHLPLGDILVFFVASSMKAGMTVTEIIE